jgi:hypothetical protein
MKRGRAQSDPAVTLAAQHDSSKRSDGFHPSIRQKPVLRHRFFFAYRPKAVNFTM